MNNLPSTLQIPPQTIPPLSFSPSEPRTLEFACQPFTHSAVPIIYILALVYYAVNPLPTMLTSLLVGHGRVLYVVLILLLG